MHFYLIDNTIKNHFLFSTIKKQQSHRSLLVAFQDHFNYYGPTHLIMGRGTIGNIPQIVNEKQVKKAQIVTDRGLVQAGVVARVTKILDKAHIAYSIYDGVEPNPPICNVEACAEQYQSENCDFLLTIGGGSSMDVAKTSGVLVNHGGKITDYFIGEKPVPGPIPFLLCVPTTYGTASEVTPFAVITDDNHFKGTVAGPHVIPDVGILDADMAVALPLPIAAATGMDALTHAIESYVSLMSNPISEGMALHAIRLISQNLRQAAYSDHNHEATQTHDHRQHHGRIRILTNALGKRTCHVTSSRRSLRRTTRHCQLDLAHPHHDLQSLCLPGEIRRHRRRPG